MQITEGYAYSNGSLLVDWKNQISVGYSSAGTGSLEVNTDSIGNGFKTATGTTLYIGNVENSMGGPLQLKEMEHLGLLNLSLLVNMVFEMPLATPAS